MAICDVFPDELVGVDDASPRFTHLTTHAQVPWVKKRANQRNHVRAQRNQILLPIHVNGATYIKLLLLNVLAHVFFAELVHLEAKGRRNKKKTNQKTFKKNVFFQPTSIHALLYAFYFAAAP
jgi:hypothetical protein